MKISMIQKLAVFALLFTGTGAFADGFDCITSEGDLAVTVYNYVDAQSGTRTAANMIVSNPNVGAGRRTIAKFTAANETLTTDHEATDGLVFYGIVDLRFNDSGRKGEYLMGTRLGEVEYIRLDVAHNYSYPVEDGELVGGAVSVVKRDGEVLSSWATCTRYLKGE